MFNLNYEQVVAINKEIVTKTREPFSVLNENNIKSALGNQFQPYELEEQAIASTFKSLIINHGFANGNKRTAVICLRAFSVELKCNDNSLYELTYSLANEGGSKISVNHIANILFDLDLDEDLGEDIDTKHGDIENAPFVVDADGEKFAFDTKYNMDAWIERNKHSFNEIKVIKEDLNEDIEKHDTLNPKLFDSEELKPEVKETIEKIAKTFIDELANDDIKFDLKDIVLLGSNVSYNYTKDSDLDIHLIADSKDLHCPDELYPLLYSAYRSMFNKNYDITIKGIPSEIYVEMDTPAAKSNGIYSLNTGWIKKPVQTNIPDLDQEAFDKLFTEWEDKYFDLIKDEPSIEITGNKEDVEKAKEILDKEFEFNKEENIRDKEE